tara:strand:+ start:460 stop:675 length:216 start_codon:yes stop_codon:yes gene_type:complete
MSFREDALDSLKHNAEKDRSEALTSLKIMLDHPAGIGDHSTGDLHENLNEALSKLADAEDRLDTLKIHFNV